MPINFAHRLVVSDGPVFFCCPRCVEKYQAAPSTFTEQVALQREALADLPRVQVTCPVSGDPVLEDVLIEHGGTNVRFCSTDCAARFKSDPGAYANNLAATYCYQAACPVSGERISPTVSAEVASGDRVYFCSDKCRAEFVQDPSLYASKLAEQGFRLHL